MLEGDITFDKIIEKTKRMLGKNYRGDKEMVPVYSNLAPIEGHTDSFLVVSNNGFSDEEVALIQEKTKNYSWWVANHGYLVDNTRKEIPALFIYGSEAGDLTPDVLNFKGLNNNGFYLPIDRTNMIGDVNNSSNHIFVQFIKDGEKMNYETDIDGINNGLIAINEVEYEFYAGRLYPEDRRVVNNEVVYPIYLISNLDYYCISDETATALGGAHNTDLVEKNNLEILEDVCEMVTHEAAQWTNRKIGTALLNECWPVIIKCSCMAYLNRGVEGLGSQSELGQQNVYNDWITLMHKQITNRRYIL